MKKYSIKALSVFLILCFIMPFAFFQNDVTMAVDDDTLYAIRLGYDNGKYSGISPGPDCNFFDVDDDGKITAIDAVGMKKIIIGKTEITRKLRLVTDSNADGKVNAPDLVALLKAIVGKGVPTDNIVILSNSDVSYDNKNKVVAISPTGDDPAVKIALPSTVTKFSKEICIVFNANTASGINVYPVLSKFDSALIKNKAVKTEYSGKYYYKLNVRKSVDSIIVSLPQSSVLNVSEMFVCDGEYSAKWIIDNRINPPSGTEKKLEVTISDENVALRLGQMTEDDRSNSNGGLYHDYVNTKWPTVAIDENDKLYVAASGCRMLHVDPFGATLLVTSEDGGKTFSKPRQISNTIMDDRDAGITYLGNGAFLVTYFTNSVESYLPGGGNYRVLKLKDNGGSSASWQADMWDSYGNPLGGINGTFVDMTKYIYENDPDYVTDYASFIIKSTDYGETWNVVPYEFKNIAGTSRAMRSMLSNYQITYPGARVPVTSEHGPVKLSDGTVLYAGKVLDDTDQPVDTMAVYISLDDGDTWVYRSEIERPLGYGENNFHELSVTETKDGALLCAIRTQPSETGKMNIEPAGTVYTCFSYDKGRTWTVPEPTGIDGMPPHVLTNDNGDIIMVTGHRTDPRYIYANISTDGGRTWSDSSFCSSQCVDGDDMGYPTSVVLDDGTIVTVYYASYHYQSYSDQYSSIYAVRWKYKLGE